MRVRLSGPCGIRDGYRLNDNRRQIHTAPYGGYRRPMVTGNLPAGGDATTCRDREGAGLALPARRWRVVAYLRAAILSVALVPFGTGAACVLACLEFERTLRVSRVECRCSVSVGRFAQAPACRTSGRRPRPDRQ